MQANSRQTILSWLKHRRGHVITLNPLVGGSNPPTPIKKTIPKSEVFYFPISHNFPCIIIHRFNNPDEDTACISVSY